MFLACIFCIEMGLLSFPFFVFNLFLVFVFGEPIGLVL
uniref:Uncharacterized protein n=1 Tax=Rhizophora mucronata TaxID=61149 RepID=A0A2P2Q0P0_RHIMU